MYSHGGNTSDSLYYLNCTNLTIQRFQDMNIVRGTTALICMAVSVMMLVVLCLSKAYTSFVQRMLLYLVIATVLAEICHASNMQNLIEFSNKETVCTVLGLVTN